LPSSWGLRDMLGNVNEWCLDHYQAYPQGTVLDPHPSGSSEGVARGGCFEDTPADCNAARRFTIWTHYSSPSVGFRILVEAVTKPPHRP
jgi:sulfatase modifying factor 1